MTQSNLNLHAVAEMVGDLKHIREYCKQFKDI